MTDRQFKVTIESGTRIYCLDHDKFESDCGRCGFMFGASIKTLKEEKFDD